VTCDSNLKIGLCHTAYVFTEQVVIMLSSILRNPKDIKINIKLYAFFVKSKNIINQDQLLEKIINGLEGRWNKSFKKYFPLFVIYQYRKKNIKTH